MVLRILGVAPKLGEKGVALKVGEKAASHFTPLHATGGMRELKLVMYVCY